MKIPCRHPENPILIHHGATQQGKHSICYILWRSFGCSRSPWSKVAFFSLPQEKPQQPLGTYSNILHQLSSGCKSNYIHSDGAGLGRGISYGMNHHCWIHPYPSKAWSPSPLPSLQHSAPNPYHRNKIHHQAQEGSFPPVANNLWWHSLWLLLSSQHLWDMHSTSKTSQQVHLPQKRMKALWEPAMDQMPSPNESTPSTPDPPQLPLISQRKKLRPQS